MKKALLLIGFVASATAFTAQVSPAVSSWLQNTSTIGTYYVAGNSTPVTLGILEQCQQVEYNSTDVYISCTGVPGYPSGPFLDGNPSIAEDQNAIFKFPLNPQENTGTLTETSAGNIGVFIDGVALFDYRDGVSWDSNTGAPCGGPGGSPCTGSLDWNRDAIPAEMDGFDCSKGHPAGGNYHHHQNPSAFDLDLNVVSTICTLYDADGLYAMDSTQHSPLIGYAYDGFPIYGAYGYQNEDGTGGIKRIESGYQLRSISVRTHHADGTNVDDGPAVDATYWLGYFREDYEWVAHPGDEEFLDEHNGRFCVTPEYPAGTYAYFCTVDSDWNSAYPYAIGPTFYGIYSNALVTSIPGGTTVYTGPTSISEELETLNYTVFPNPASDLISVQIKGLVKKDLKVELIDVAGKLVKSAIVNAGQTIAFIDVQDVYEGTYIIRISNAVNETTRKVVITR